MKIFHSDADQDNTQNQREFQEQLDALEDSAGELRQTIGYRRTLLKNAEKKLQQFQDTIYAMLIEEEYPRKKSVIIQDDDGESPPF
ncbi:hypothetical protein CSA56_11795 [candidate division KSB3 bacterium]|uniref:Uncharacterized protein n=1 Tax=candidate division KSB3 bacterium TaxID=2044937 RepID=A0A2G6KF95_9BACT|nr:MAG: hypothetical protein CSA56_11795 [candidate division KSB3 bacterium]